jgi:predicted nucleic acid-binding Zn ribbon protein
LKTFGIGADVSKPEWQLIFRDLLAQHSVYRVIQPSGIIFKGSGFYVTDNRGTSRSAASTNGNGSESGTSESSTTTPKTETKTETKSETKSEKTTASSSDS